MNITGPSQATTPSQFHRLTDWIRTNKTGILVNIFAWFVLLPVLPLLGLFWKGIASATPAPTTVLSALQSDLVVPAWMLPALFLLPLVLLHLFWYVRLYRYSTDKFGGVIWRWRYSFPMGRVTGIRGRCQVCREPFDEQTFLMFGCSNFKCENCGTITDETPRNWPDVIKRKVRSRFNKCPD